jgi:peroxiredoxin Q/BCP
MGTKLYPIVAALFAGLLGVAACGIAEAAPGAAAVTLGKAAPEFKLPNQDDKPTSLADYKGKWVVLYFYPKDDTPGCTIEACDFRDGLSALEKLNAVVLGVSPDSAESHRAFIAKHKLTITLLADTKKEVIDEYGAWDTEKKRVRRSTVIIDPAGNVAYHWPAVTPKGHVEEVKAKLRELQKK